MTAVDPVERPKPPATVDPRPERPLTGVCPYLAAVDGGWRSATVAREHRCGAVSPPAPLAAEKQRRLCLTADHRTCATYEAARAARQIPHGRVPALPRPVARTTPVILDHGRLTIDMPAFRADRSVWQALLIGLLVIAFAAIVLTRVTDGGASGAGGASPTPGATAGASAGAGGVGASGSPSTVGPSASAVATQGSGASAAPTDPGAPSAASRTYKVKVGETLVGIAAKFGTTSKALAALNGITDPSSLRVGQILKIP